MFNWFKNKLNSLLPADINKGFMSSNFCSLKLGTKVSVPNNMFCFVSYKDKTYLELPAGSHYLDENNLKNLCLKQFGKKKEKRIKVDLFFVNCEEFEREIKFKEKLPINQKLTRTIILVNFKVKVVDARKFSDLIQGEMSCPNAEKTDGVVEGYFVDFLHNFFLKKEFNSTIIETEVLEELNNKASVFFASLGMELLNLELKISTPTIEIKEEKKFEFLKTFNSVEEKKEEKIIDQTEKIEYTTTKSEENIKNENTCPSCKSKIIANSWYCHRCGYRLK